MKYKNDSKTLLILDVDETLIYASKEELEYPADFVVFDYHVYKRPYLDEFLEQVAADFLIGIWSSASDDYVEAIVRAIIPSMMTLEFVWARSRCTYKRNIQMDEYGYYTDNIFSHYHYVKPLKKLKRKGYTLDRMLIVDDTPHKCQDNYGNAIYPQAFTGEKNDDELEYLVKYLRSLKDELNVRHIEKRNWRNKISSRV